MSRFINIPNGDYTLKVQSGGTIALDTGIESGTVYVSGDLVVAGTTTTIESTELSITDNVIVVNAGETGPGITLTEAGLRVDRGTRPDAFFVYDEDLTDPIVSNTTPGLFTFKLDGGGVKGIRTNAITTGGTDLLLVGSGTGVITVTGTTDYESNVTDDDDITNKKYVDDTIVEVMSAAALTDLGTNLFSTDGTLAANSDTIVPTERAIKTYVDASSQTFDDGTADINVNQLTAGQIVITADSISNSSSARININDNVMFTGSVSGAPVAMAYFLTQ